MPEPDIEVWAVCDTCDRSFFVPSQDASEPETVLCPVCAAAPARLEQRSGGEIVEVQS